MSNRRNFLKQFSAGTALLSIGTIPIQAFAKRDVVKITILHTNDVHSRIDPFPDNDPKFAGKGGVANRATIINEIRNTEPNVLLFDAGDMFQGTPYYNMFGGEVEIKLMSLLGYDAGTIGNHDFDNGLDALAKQLVHANFPLINANYDFNNTAMHGKTLPCKIFEKDGIRIGVFGVGIELKGLVPDKHFGATIYNNPLETSATQAHYLKKTQKCDLVICLSHLGFKYPDDKVSDEVLAKSSANIDLIIGAHTHTFIDTPYKYYNRFNEEVLVAQVGWGGIKLGRIDFFIDKRLKRKNATSINYSIGK